MFGEETMPNYLKVFEGMEVVYPDKKARHIYAYRIFDKPEKYRYTEEYVYPDSKRVTIFEKTIGREDLMDIRDQAELDPEMNVEFDEVDRMLPGLDNDDTPKDQLRFPDF